MVRKALEKLSEKQLSYCKVLSALIDRAKVKGLKEEYERNMGKLRGFLECLCQMEVITGAELKACTCGFLKRIECRKGRQL